MAEIIYLALAGALISWRKDPGTTRRALSITLATSDCYRPG